MKRLYGSAAAPQTKKDIRKVRSPKLAHLVAEQLREKIAKGELGPGDTLPPETDLLGRFGISRPTLREALRVLESESLIQLGRGSRTGATVLGPSIEAIAQRSTLYLAVQGTTMWELHQVRMLLEPPIAALLARRSKKDFIKGLQHCIEQQDAALKQQNYAAVLTAINKFHDMLVKFSENRALSLVAGILHDISIKLHPQILLAGDRRDQRRMFTKKCENAVDAYKELTKLIAAGKPADVERHWQSHMGNVADYLAGSGMAKLQVRMSQTPR